MFPLGSNKRQFRRLARQNFVRCYKVISVDKWTSIRVSKELARNLKKLRINSESYHSTVARLVEHFNSTVYFAPSDVVKFLVIPLEPKEYNLLAFTKTPGVSWHDFVMSLVPSKWEV